MGLAAIIMSRINAELSEETTQHINVFASLNSAQAEAVSATDGPVMILAGAGAGKTTTLIRRVANLILKGVSPSSIMAVTFTNKAASELRERLYGIVGGNAKHVVAGTFHSIIFRKILKRFSSPAFLARNALKDQFVIIDKSDSSKLLKESLKELSAFDREQIIKNGWKLKDFEQKLTVARANGLSSMQFRKAIKPGSKDEEMEKTAASLWDIYEKKCRSANGIDFDDILLLGYDLIINDPYIASVLGDEFTHIMLDEYQDTNPVQMKIMDEIAKKHRNICVVGDEKQSIYSFRAASIDVILGFKDRYPDAVIINMNTNYRSNPAILSAANVLSSAMGERLSDGRLLAGASHKEQTPEIRCFESDKNEASGVSDRIAALIRDGETPSQIAVLYRNRSIKSSLEKELLHRNIKYAVYGDTGFFERKEVKDTIAMIRYMFHPFDSMAALRVLDAIKIGVSSKKAQQDSSERSITVHEFLLDAINKGGKKAEKIRSFVGDLSAMRESIESKDSPDHIFEDMMTIWDTYLKPGLEKYALTASADEDASISDREENVQYIFERMREHLVNGLPMEEIVEDLTLLAEDTSGRGNGDRENKVCLMTVHAAKGLEFNNVFIIGVEDENIPGSAWSEREIEEERRIFYVAMTRAKKNLCISHAKYRTVYGRYEAMHPSRFISEMGRKSAAGASKQVAYSSDGYDL